MSGVARVILFVADMAKMTQFYSDVLALDVRSSSDTWTVLGRSRGELALHLIPEAHRDPTAGDSAPRTRAAAKVCILSANPEEARASLERLGGEVTELSRWGEMVYWDGVDPEGNVFQVTNR